MDAGRFKNEREAGILQKLLVISRDSPDNADHNGGTYDIECKACEG